MLTQHGILRMPYGPGIHDAPNLLAALQREGRIRITTRPNGPYREAVYELTEPVQIDPTNPRYKAIEEAVEWVRDKSAVELSEETHLYSRSWRETRDGEPLDIYRDLLDDEELSAVVEELTQAEALVNGVF